MLLVRFHCPLFVLARVKRRWQTWYGALERQLKLHYLYLRTTYIPKAHAAATVTRPFGRQTHAPLPPCLRYWRRPPASFSATYKHVFGFCAGRRIPPTTFPFCSLSSALTLNLLIPPQACWELVPSPCLSHRLLSIKLLFPNLSCPVHPYSLEELDITCLYICLQTCEQQFLYFILPTL